MLQLPFTLPSSLVSYAEHFSDDPERATERLEQQLQKRGPDAVGHFLLAWFYYRQDDQQRAIDEAIKARIYAPGSAFFQKAPYWIAHAKTFDAWTPKLDKADSGSIAIKGNKKGPLFNLDVLIEKLSGVESIKVDRNNGETSKREDAPEDDVDNIISETLASIHEKQGNMEAAISMYQKLKGLHQDKREYYEDEIKRLERLKKEQDDSSG